MLCFYTTKTYADEIFTSHFSNSDEWIITNNSVTYEINTNEFKSASQSAGLTNTSSSSYGIEHTISGIQSDKTYTFSAFIKTNNPPPSKSFLRIAWYGTTDGSGSQLKTSDSEMITGETIWRDISITTTAPSDAHSVKLRLLVANGTAYFDDISFQQIDPISPTISVVPTPTTVNPITGVTISEAMVNPNSGESEWVELYNRNDYEVNLENWFIDDIENGGASPKQINIIIQPRSYSSIDLSSSLFNNNGDDVRLLDSSKNVVDSFSYEDSKVNYSIGKNNNVFCLQKPSKNQQNNDCEQTEIISITPTSTPSPFPTESRFVLGASTIDYISISPIPSPLPTLHRFVLSPIPQQKVEENDTIPRIDIPEFSQNKLDDSAKPWLLLSGSYSVLAFLSITFKTFILKAP